MAVVDPCSRRGSAGDYGHGHVVENLTPEEINEQDAWTAVRACPEQAVTFEQ